MKKNNIPDVQELKRHRGLIASCAFLLGLISAAAQVVLIRELMTVFSGHELVFVVVLGVWLLGIALGSALPWIRGLRWIVIFFSLSVFILPLTVVGVRLFKSVWGIPLGSVADMGVVMLATGLLLIPLTFLLGALFAVLAYQANGKAVYAWESLGFVAGGILITFVFFVPLPQGLDVSSRQAAWPGYHLVAVEQTRYGSLVVAERAGQKSFFENGRHLFTAGDLLSAEEVHAGLLVHPAPRQVFLAGGGFSQAGVEVLKHPVERLDYAELDPAVVRMERREIPFREDPRLHIMTGDARMMLRHAGRSYDVIIMNQGDPLSLSAGRFFTKEFFMLVRRRLLPGGILALTISSSENYLNDQGRAYAGSVHATLGSVFGHVRVIPGERMTFLASDVPYDVTSVLLDGRLSERAIPTQFMKDHYLNDRMSPARIAEVHAWLDVKGGAVSTDARPLASLRALVFTTTRTGTGFAKFMGALAHGQWFLWLMIPVVFIVALLMRRKFLPVTGAAVAGFTQMVFQLAALLLVQTVFGHAYAVAGILTAGFMLGAFGGVHGARYFRGETGAWAQVVLALSFIMIFWYWPAGVFVFPVLAGLAGGFQFAVYAMMAGDNNTGRIYAADVIGAGLGVVCAGLFLVPLWGMVLTMFFVAVLNLTMGLALRSYPKSVSADL